MSRELKTQISLAGKGKNFPIHKQTRDDPGLAALISKLHTAPSTNTGFDNRGMKHIQAPDFGELRGISDGVARNITDAQTVMQTLPDMEAAIQILVSSVISPKDLMNGALTFAAPEGSLPPDIASSMIARVKEHFERDYKIADFLPRMLRDILAETGSYPVAVIPENSIDELINGSRNITMESMSGEFLSDGRVKPRGILGPANMNRPTADRAGAGMAIESFNRRTETSINDTVMTLESDFKQPVETFIEVTDNFSVLKVPQINQKMREQRILNAHGMNAFTRVMGFGLEDHQIKLNDREMTAAIFKDKKFAYSPVTSLKTQEQLARRTVGNPMVMHLPSEAVIPVYVPGRVEQQVGFFVLIDADGNPLTSASDVDHYQQLKTRMTSGGNFASAMLQKVNTNLNGFSCNSRAHLDYSTRVFASMVEADILARLRNGIYGNGVAIAKKEEVYRMMFARALAKQHTQLLFLPIEFMTYFAFQFTADGIGKSRLDNMRTLNSMRSMLLFANVMAAVKNSIGRTEVKIKLDEHDPDPQKAIERIRHDLTRARMLQFPVGTNSPMDIVDFIQTANMEFTYENHPGLPDISIDINEKQSNNAKPDQELEENLRKQSIMGWGLSPSTVDATFEAEFATSVVTNNLLLAKQVMQIQDQLHPLLEDHLHKYAMNSETLLIDLRAILNDNYDKIARRAERKKATGLDVPPPPISEEDKQEQNKETPVSNPSPIKTTDVGKEIMIRKLLYEFVMNFTVSLPRPNSATLENQMIALDTYTKALDQCLDAYFNSEFLNSDTLGDIERQVSAVKAATRAHYLRKWMADNGCMTELAELTTTDEDGKPMVDIYKMTVDHNDAIAKSTTFFYQGIQVVKQAANAVVEKIENNDTTQEAGSSSSSDTGGGGDGGMGGFGDGLGDIPDFGDENAVDPLKTEDDNETPADPLDDPAAADPQPDDAAPIG